jgi:hypothetical protein
MLYKILADTVVFLHLLWIVFLIFGAFWGVRNKMVKTIHITGLLFAIVIQTFGWYCPLTDLETWLRSKHNPSLSYGGSFIAHYMEKIIYVELPRSLIFALTLLLIALNAWLYFKKKR